MESKNIYFAYEENNIDDEELSTKLVDSWKSLLEILSVEINIIENFQAEISPIKYDILYTLSTNDIFTKMKDLYFTHMMDFTPIKTWKDFLYSFRTMLLECFDSTERDSTSKQINRVFFEKTEKYEKELCKNFMMENSFRPLQTIFQEKKKTPFDISRELSILFCGYSRASPFFTNFQYTHWKYLLEHIDDFVEKRLEWDKIYSFVVTNIPLVSIIQEKKINVKYYQFFTHDLNGFQFSRKPLDSCFLQNFCHPKTNISSDGIVWVANRFPYTILINSRFITQEKLNEIQETPLSFSVFEKVSFSFAPQFHRDFLKKFCNCATGYLLPYETWKFIDTKRNVSFQVILKECFHIVGRLSRRYKLREYHESFLEKLEKSMLSHTKLYCIPESIVFPELSFQSKEWKIKWNEIWAISFNSFQKDFFDCMEQNLCCKEFFQQDYELQKKYSKLLSVQFSLEKSIQEQQLSNIPILYVPQQKQLRQQQENLQKNIDSASMKILHPSLLPTMTLHQNLCEYIGTEYFSQVLNKKKTYVQYFSSEFLLPPITHKIFDNRKAHLEWFSNQSFTSHHKEVNTEENYRKFLKFVDNQVTL
jgi:hypothetical protein